MSDVDAAVIGAGVVGLACGIALAKRGMQVVVLEGAGKIGTATSSRNSEVIHAGIYYPKGSLKARLCVEGRRRLYEFCARRSVPHKKLGKVIFARNPAEFSKLDEILERARDAGVDDLKLLSQAEIATLEPELACEGAIFSPSTGIIDAHALMLAFEGELDELGGQVVCNSSVVRITRAQDAWELHIAGHEGPAISSRAIVNSAGLQAPSVAHTVEGLLADYVPEPAYARGCYFSYTRPVPFRHLIYPVPVPGGLGTHLTFDMAGRARFGPNVQWLDCINYSVDPALHAEFLAAARLIWRGIEADALIPGYAGIRPKVRTAAGIATDFVISGAEQHGMAGLVNLFGIESPGLTAALAVGEEVAGRLEPVG